MEIYKINSISYLFHFQIISKKLDIDRGEKVTKRNCIYLEGGLENVFRKNFQLRQKFCTVMWSSFEQHYFFLKEDLNFQDPNLYPIINHNIV